MRVRDVLRRLMLTRKIEMDEAADELERMKDENLATVSRKTRDLTKIVEKLKEHASTQHEVVASNGGAS